MQRVESGLESQGVKLRRTLGVPALVFYGTGIILGAGIYSIIGKAAGLVGPSLWMSFLMASVCAGLTALSYCELATLEPLAGAEYIYVHSAYPNHPWLATSIGLIMALAGTATASAVALAFGGYLRDFISLAPIVTGLILLVLLTIINIVGIRESSWVNVIFTLIEVFGLIVFIVLGFSVEKFAVVLSHSPSPHVVTGAALTIFAYFGFEDIVNLTEETRDPGRAIPKAILWSLGISTVLYILVSLAAVSLASVEALSSSEAPLMDAVRSTSRNMAIILGICALFSTANTVLIAMLAASRAFFGMAVDGNFPAIFSKILPQSQTPWLASVLVLVLSAILLPVGGLDIIAGISSLATLLGFLAVNVALIKLRYSEANRFRIFKVPFNIGKFPILSTLGGLSTIVLILQFPARVYKFGFFCMGFIMVSQFVYNFLKQQKMKKI